MTSLTKALFATYKQFFSGKYALLLLFLVLLFIFRPYDPSLLYFSSWKVFLTATLILAIFNCEHTKWVKAIISLLAVPSVILTWLDLFSDNEIIVISFAFFTILFIFVCTASILYDVLSKAQVTPETLRGVICAYFLIAFMFSYIYFLIEYIEPASFSISSKTIPIFPYPYYLAQMLYLSFITLLTIGFGDIVPVRDIAQTAVVLEGIIGQFYIAILVSRLVGIYAFNSNKRLLEKLEKAIRDKN